MFKVDEPGQDREILSLYDAFLVAQAAVDFWKENQLSSELGTAASRRPLASHTAGPHSLGGAGAMEKLLMKDGGNVLMR